MDGVFAYLSNVTYQTKMWMHKPKIWNKVESLWLEIKISNVRLLVACICKQIKERNKITEELNLGLPQEKPVFIMGAFISICIKQQCTIFWSWCYKNIFLFTMLCSVKLPNLNYFCKKSAIVKFPKNVNTFFVIWKIVIFTTNISHLYGPSILYRKDIHEHKTFFGWVGFQIEE